jgi:hypothetical protein
VLAVRAQSAHEDDDDAVVMEYQTALKKAGFDDVEL